MTSPFPRIEVRASRLAARCRDRLDPIFRNTRRAQLTCLNLRRNGIAHFALACSAPIARLRGDYIPESFGAIAMLSNLFARRAPVDSGILRTRL
jgi:hypothetical protein